MFQRWFVILLALLALAVPVLAQEVTPEPPVVLPPDAVVSTGAQLLLYLALAALGGGGLLAILFRFLDRREARETAEKLYNSLPPDQQAFIKELVEGYRELSNRMLDFFTDITTPDETPQRE